MNSEEKIQNALSGVLPAYHLTLDGRPEAGIVWRKAGEKCLYESDRIIQIREVFDVNIYQMQYDGAQVIAAADALTAAGFLVSRQTQTMEDEYYRDSLRAMVQKEEN